MIHGMTRHVANGARLRQDGIMRITAFLAVTLMTASPVLAGTTAWYETTGGKIRLVTQSAVDAQGILRAVLDISLDDGWKTYWKEPGETGVAPQISVASANGTASIRFPAPQRFDDGVSQWAGYEGRVRLPIELSNVGDISSPLTLDVFLGVCETICVPVQASLSVTPGEDSGPIEEAQIDAAFAALPEKAHAGFEVTGATVRDAILTVNVETPGGESPPDLFLAGRNGAMFAAPEFEMTSQGGRFTARIVRGGSAGPVEADYTLVRLDRAVSGVLVTD
jgi:DsbC/DsbD-like thiol-disulfide interchange protein